MSEKTEEKKNTEEDLISDDISPMMRHYLQTKEEYPDCLLFYRLGDFYELFFDDAKTVSRELDLTLTGKSCGLKERAPMCGVPYHAVDGYINKLIKQGYHVAICEQTEDPKLAKGIVKREVTRVITPGTTIDSTSLDESKNNYLLSLFYGGESVPYGLAFSDISTGAFFVSEASGDDDLFNQLDTIAPSEIIVNEPFFMSSFPSALFTERTNVRFSPLDPVSFDQDNAVRVLKKQFKVNGLSSLGVTAQDCFIPACGALLDYLYETQKISLLQITSFQRYSNGSFMLLDFSTKRNLELVETMRDKKKQGSLLWVLDHTKTAMGARYLRNQIERPLIKKADIIKRLDAVAELKDDIMTTEELREYLSGIYDLERLLTRITYHTAGPRDLIALKNSAEALPGIKTVLSNSRSEALKTIADNTDPLSDIKELLEKAIKDEPPMSVHDGNFFREGYSEEIDRLRSAKLDGKKWVAELEAKEREKTDIKNLKVKCNKVFGYYLEVSNSFKDKVPDYFIRKQTLVNAERYYTPELKELENTILGSEDRLASLEKTLYTELLEKLSAETKRIQETAALIAELDFFQSLAYTADKNRYVRPDITTDGVINITGGRHPVIEKIRPDELFIENDTLLDKKEHRTAIITGPNMAGKSTYMRQTALIVLMAQMGSFVPAKEASIGIVDRIFTRVGASDDLGSGQSTFMVEMNEVANILKNATKDSLLILDEIGRGTSTYDGLSIAWAVVEYISNEKKLGAKTLFATHYHELTELEGRLSGVRNYCVAVKEGGSGDTIVFLRKIVRGGADKSYGIAVARLAGLPDEVLNRASEISKKLSDNDISAHELPEMPSAVEEEPSYEQLSLFGGSEYVMTENERQLLVKMKELKTDEMTPLDALNTLSSLTKLL